MYFGVEQFSPVNETIRRSRDSVRFQRGPPGYATFILSRKRLSNLFTHRCKCPAMHYFKSLSVPRSSDLGRPSRRVQQICMVSYAANLQIAPLLFCLALSIRMSGPLILCFFRTCQLYTLWVTQSHEKHVYTHPVVSRQQSKLPLTCRFYIPTQLRSNSLQTN
jgi:hypothetical protein